MTAAGGIASLTRECSAGNFFRGGRVLRRACRSAVAARPILRPTRCSAASGSTELESWPDGGRSCGVNYPSGTVPGLREQNIDTSPLKCDGFAVVEERPAGDRSGRARTRQSQRVRLPRSPADRLGTILPIVGGNAFVVHENPLKEFSKCRVRENSVLP